MPRKERDEKDDTTKGRLLKSGESQRSDGRYAYKYIDTFGEPQFVYFMEVSTLLTKYLPGKLSCLSLREKIKQIQKDLDDGIDTIGKKMTVCQLYEKVHPAARECAERNSKEPPAVDETCLKISWARLLLTA